MKMDQKVVTSVRLSKFVVYYLKVVACVVLVRTLSLVITSQLTSKMFDTDAVESRGKHMQHRTDMNKVRFVVDVISIEQHFLCRDYGHTCFGLLHMHPSLPNVVVDERRW